MAAGQPFDYVATVWSFGERATIPAGTTRHLAAHGGANQTLPNETGLVVLHAGTVKSLTWSCSSSTLNGVKSTITVYLNGVATAVATSWPTSTTSGKAGKGEIPVKPGDVLSMRIQTASGAGSIARPRASVELVVPSTNPWWSNAGGMYYAAAGRIGIGTDSPAETLSVQGTIESIAGGFKFPDGTVQATAAAAPQPGMPPGSVIAYAGATVPAGWLLCDGTLLLKTDYPALFAAIGIGHGESLDQQQFALPDYRGLFLRGVSGSSGGVDPDADTRYAMGPMSTGNTGNNVGSKQWQQMYSHQHSIGVGVGDSTSMVLGGGTTRRLASFVIDQWNGPTEHWSGVQGAGYETRPVNAYVNFLIKT